MSIKGYKVFNPDWTCRGFKFEVGKTYKHNGNIGLCEKGFHFCRKASDCFNYYSFASNNHVAEVEAIGLVESDKEKSVTDEITIIREIQWQELLSLVNQGKDCTGLCNSGDCNSGNCNSGDCNSGNWNSGDWNSGNCNSGDCNSGNRNSGNCNSGDCNSGNFNSGDCNSGNWNSGDWNSGDWNSGDWNSGNCNSGNWNSGDWNSGFFCTDTPKVRAFNVQTDISREEWLNIKGVQVLNWKYENNWWIYSENMSDNEKKEYPDYEIMGGYLKTVSFKEACKIMWKNLDEDEKQAIKDIPYFDAKVFKEITGIEVM